MDDPLLTPQEVASLLQVSVKTVYAHAVKLGGFYPGGIRVLRFKREAVYGLMEGQGKGRLEVQLRVQKTELRRGGIPDQKRGKSGMDADARRVVMLMRR